MAVDPAAGIVNQLSGGALNIGLLLVIAMIAGVLFVLMAAAVWVALKRNWIIIKWPYKAIIFRPVGTTIAPLIDSCAPVVDGKENKWKLKSLNFKFTPPDRKYILPGNFVVGWSAKFGEFMPIMPRVVGWMGQVDPDRMKLINVQASEATLSKDLMQGILAQIKERWATIPEFNSAPPAQQNQTIKRDYEEAILAKLAEVRQQTHDDLMEAYQKELAETALVVQPQFDVGIANSHMAEGDKINRFFGGLDEWKQAIPWIVLLICICVFALIIISLVSGNNSTVQNIATNCANQIAAAAHGTIANATANVNTPAPI